MHGGLQVHVTKTSKTPERNPVKHMSEESLKPLRHWSMTMFSLELRCQKILSVNLWTSMDHKVVDQKPSLKCQRRQRPRTLQTATLDPSLLTGF